MDTNQKTAMLDRLKPHVDLTTQYCYICKKCYKDGTRLHMMPQDKVMNAKWKSALRVKKALQNKIHVCSKHFKQEDFESSNYSTANLKKRLKTGAIPSLHLKISNKRRSSECSSSKSVVEISDSSNEEEFSSQENYSQDEFFQSNDLYIISESSDALITYSASAPPGGDPGNMRLVEVQEGSSTYMVDQSVDEETNPEMYVETQDSDPNSEMVMLEAREESDGNTDETELLLNRPTLSDAEIPRTCRICLENTGQWNIFRVMSNFRRRIHEMIMSFTDAGIYENDGLPHEICSICLKELRQVIQFKEQCENTDNILKLRKQINQAYDSPTPCAAVIDGLSQMCRVCLNMFALCNIFIIMSNFGEPIYRLIMSVADIEIFQDDLLPIGICNSCLIDLRVSIIFKQKCEATDNVLRNGQIYYTSADGVDASDNNVYILIPEHGEMVHDSNYEFADPDVTQQITYYEQSQPQQDEKTVENIIVTVEPDYYENETEQNVTSYTIQNQIIETDENGTINQDLSDTTECFILPDKTPTPIYFNEIKLEPSDVKPGELIKQADEHEEGSVKNSVRTTRYIHMQ